MSGTNNPRISSIRILFRDIEVRKNAIEIKKLHPRRD